MPPIVILRDQDCSRWSMVGIGPVCDLCVVDDAPVEVAVGMRCYMIQHALPV